MPLTPFISELHALEFSDHLGPLPLHIEPRANKRSYAQNVKTTFLQNVIHTSIEKILNTRGVDLVFNIFSKMAVSSSSETVGASSQVLS